MREYPIIFSLFVLGVWPDSNISLSSVPLRRVRPFVLETTQTLVRGLSAIICIFAHLHISEQGFMASAYLRICAPYLFFRLTLNLMPPALPAWYAMSPLPSCVSLYTLSISPSANKSQQKVSPTLSCALRLLVTSNILLPIHRNVQLRSGSQRTITSSPTCSSLDKHALLKNISLCDAIVCPPFTEIPPPGCKNLQNRQIPRN